MDRVFGVGNVVTGQGNIRVSLVHSQKVTNHLIENCMGAVGGNGNVSVASDGTEQQIANQMDAIEKKIEVMPPLSDKQSRSRGAADSCTTGKGRLHLRLRFLDRQGNSSRSRMTFFVRRS